MHRPIDRVLVAPIMGFLAACTSPLSTAEVLALGQAEVRWAARPFQAYTYETRTSCGECARWEGEWARVAVNHGKVVGVVFVANDSALSAEDQLAFATVDGLFAQIRGYQHDEWVRDVRVTFDPQLGYPTYISTSAKAGTIDGGAAQYIHNLLPTP